MSNRYFRIWTRDGEPTSANPPAGYSSADDAERAAPFHASAKDATSRLRDGTVIIGVAIPRGK